MRNGLRCDETDDFVKMSRFLPQGAILSPLVLLVGNKFVFL